MNQSKQTTHYEFYRIEVQGALDAAWADWLNGAVIHIERQAEVPGNTIFIVKVPDQSALRGLLGRLWNLNLALVSLQKLASSEVTSLIEENTAQETPGGDK